MRSIKLSTVLIFAGLVALGLWMAWGRPLWVDEFYSLNSSILKVSYKTIWLGGINEGNNSPLFYFLQKLQCDSLGYHAPQEWLQGHWGGVHSFDQMFLRIQPVLILSAGLSSLFYYFARRDSLLVGFYALAVAMTSSLFWGHWTEARPYALWFALSFWQILLLLDILQKPGARLLGYLALVHILLALTVTISAIQIMAATVVLWAFCPMALAWYLPLAVLPAGVCGFYYMHAPHYSFAFVHGPVSLINANIPKDRLFFIFVAAALLFFQCRFSDWKTYLENKYLVFVVLMLTGFAFVLFKLKKGAVAPSQGFEISSRYFLSLTPVGIVGVVLFSEYLLRRFPSRPWNLTVAAVLAVFLTFRIYKVIQG